MVAFSRFFLINTSIKYRCHVPVPTCLEKRYINEFDGSLKERKKKNITKQLYQIPEVTDFQLGVIRNRRLTKNKMSGRELMAQIKGVVSLHLLDPLECITKRYPVGLEVGSL